MLNKYKTKGKNYAIPQIDLSVKHDGIPDGTEYLFGYSVVDEGRGYLGHPDSLLLKNGDILVFYPEGHGKGRTLTKKSRDGGKSWFSGVKNPPESWKYSRETPTVYRLKFSDPEKGDALILICGNPIWQGEKSKGGFDCSLSFDEGEVWMEYESFYTEKDEKTFYPIVSMSSLVRLRENGKFVDKWMGFFHERDFVNYKTVLTFDKNGKMHWSQPQPYFSAYREIEKKSQMCEVQCIRSDGGNGDELMLITRSNSKKINSLISFSGDEGKTWSPPREAPSSINGERHKALWLPDGRLFITFRSVERSRKKLKENHCGRLSGWFSEGWVAWVGSYEQLKAGQEGDYRIKIAHTYLDSQTSPAARANDDTGYCGNVVLNDGTIVTCSYGIFSTDGDFTGEYKTDKGKKKRKTFIVSKRIRLSDVEKLLKKGTV